MSVQPVSYEVLAREAVVAIVTKHIECRAAAAQCRLAKRNAESYARSLVKRWSMPNVLAFYCLAKENKKLVPSSVLARESGGTQKSLRSWWRRLRRAAVPGIPIDAVGLDAKKMDLFKIGRDRSYGPAGYKLQLNTALLPFGLAKAITDGTLAARVTHELNWEGAADAQEADTTHSEEDRTRARRLRDRELANNAEPEEPQAKLFDKGSK